VRIYCTYFDHRYLPKGLALLESLRRHCAPFQLWVFCLDEPCRRVLADLGAPELRLVTLPELESWAPELTAAKANRTLIEFYFTLTPFLPQFVMEHSAEAELVTYLDSDLYFFSPAEDIFAEIGTASVGIIEHRFRPALRRLEQFGRFNVGFLTFRRSPAGLAVLEWWRDRCVEWCYDRVENDRFADQKYLDSWPETFPEVHVVQHKGANVAPWNIGNYSIALRKERVYVDDRPLAFYHFHSLKRRAPGVFDPHLHQYETQPSRAIRRLIYGPYLQALDRAERLIGDRLAHEQATPAIRQVQPRPRGVVERLMNRQRALRSVVHQACRGDFIFFAGGRAL
jgi:hypothetical protein